MSSDESVGIAWVIGLAMGVVGGCSVAWNGLPIDSGKFHRCKVVCENANSRAETIYFDGKCDCANGAKFEEPKNAEH